MHRIIRWYKAIALILLNSLVLFLIINLVSLGIILLMGRGDDTAGVYTMENFKKAYPQYTDDEIKALRMETYKGYIYEPYQGYREIPRRGRYVSVSESGYRYNEANQPEIEDSTIIPVFIFGGSTSFGYGVADSNTVAAYLDRKIKKINPSYCVYNFGAAAFFSNEELIWFKRSLKVRNKPAIVIFLDGLNELGNLDDDPMFSSDIRQVLGVMDEGVNVSFNTTYLSNLPVRQLYFMATSGSAHYTLPDNADSSLIKYLVNRYQTNCHIENYIATLYHIKTLFVVQPVPQYDYDLNYHVFKAEPTLHDPYIKDGYPLLKSLSSDTILDRLWLGEMQHGIRKNLYVDNVHYTPEMNHMIADSIFRRIAPMVRPVHQ